MLPQHWVPAGSPALACTRQRASSCPMCDAVLPVPARRVYVVPVFVDGRRAGTWPVSGRVWDSLAEISLGWPRDLEVVVRSVDGVQFLDPVFS